MTIWFWEVMMQIINLNTWDFHAQIPISKLPHVQINILKS